jgi:hypothetical protein
MGGWAAWHCSRPAIRRDLPAGGTTPPYVHARKRRQRIVAHYQGGVSARLGGSLTPGAISYGEISKDSFTALTCFAADIVIGISGTRLTFCEAKDQS